MLTSDQGSRWYHGLSAAQWIILAVASAGWIFDVYEGQLFTIFKTPMLTELTGGQKGVIDWQANIGFAAFLLGGAAGGLVFGVLGDRYGRVRIMSATILVYSLFSALTALVHSLWQVHLLRFLVAVGTGGEWAVAAALVAETFPPRSRATASGLFHASSVIGVALASLTGMVFARPDLWRWAFLARPGAGLDGALDPDRACASRSPGPPRRTRGASGHPGSPMTWSSGPCRRSRNFPRRPPISPSCSDRGPGDRGRCWVSVWPRSDSGPTGASSPGARSSARSDVGRVRLAQGPPVRVEPGLLADELHGRAPRLALIRAAGQLAGSAIRLRRVSRGSGDLRAADLPRGPDLSPGPRAALQSWPSSSWECTRAMRSISPNSFPTRLRATGASVCFNLGRVLGAVVLVIRGKLGEWFGLRWAVVAISSLFLVGLVLLVFAPETRGKKLLE